MRTTNIKLNADELLQALTDLRDHVRGKRMITMQTRGHITRFFINGFSPNPRVIQPKARNAFLVGRPVSDGREGADVSYDPPP